MPILSTRSPLNIDPASVVIDDVSMSPFGTPYRPSSPNGTWTNDTFTRPGSLCTGLPNYYSFGYGGQYDIEGNPYDGSEVNPSGSEYTCLYTAGTAIDPANITVNFGVLPAYSQVLLRWHGKVKAASDIGVYPGNPSGPLQRSASGLDPASIYPTGQGDYRYCGNEGLTRNTGDYTIPGVIEDCTDYEYGLQGVSNFGFSTIDNSKPAFSNITYSPIPGDIGVRG